MSVLDQLDDWPVDNVAAAIVLDGSTTVHHGDLSRRFHLASVTKLLTAYAVLVAVEEEAITLDSAAGPVGATVEHLLSHASGLAFDTDDQEAGAGEKRIYSNTGYDILAGAVAQASGIDFAEYATEAVFTPLAMSDTEMVGPAGHGVRSTVADLARFAGEVQRPRVVAEQTLTDATSVHFPGLDGFVPGYGRHRPNDWGLGFEIRSDKSPHWTGTSNSAATFGHFGQSGTFLWVDPDLGAACVVLTDRDFGAWAKPLWTDFNDSVVAAIRAGRGV